MKTPRRISVAELLKRIEREAENIDKKVEDAQFLQDGARSLRMMCRSNPTEPEDLVCVHNIAEMHGFIGEDEELEMPEAKEVQS